MESQKGRSRRVPTANQVMRQGSAGGRTSGALTAFLEGPAVGPESGVLDAQQALAGKHIAVSSVARRQNAVEKIDAMTNGMQDIRRRPHSHQIARFAIGQLRPPLLHRLAVQLSPFTDTHPTERIAGEVELDQIVEGLLA